MLDEHGSSLFIKSLLQSGPARDASQEIVHGDAVRHDYAELGRRIDCLAVGLLSPGARTGDTVAVMDWDTHRYIECFFAIPMAGLEMHTINIRLSAEQLAYTINQARDDTTGTTGLPKAVHFSHRQLVLQTLACRSALGGPGEGRFNHDDVYMPVTPMFHVHAWGLRCVATLMASSRFTPGDTCRIGC